MGALKVLAMVPRVVITPNKAYFRYLYLIFDLLFSLIFSVRSRFVGENFGNNVEICGNYLSKGKVTI